MISPSARCGGTKLYPIHHVQLEHDHAISRSELTLQDTRYLAPIIKQVEQEDLERAEWDSLVVEKKK